MRKILKNKWFWVAVIVAFLWWNYRRNVAAKQGNSTVRTNAPVTVQPWQGNMKKVKYFVTLLSFNLSRFELICQRSKEAGMDGIILNVEVGRILQKDGSYNWSEYDSAFQIAAKYGLLIDVKIMFQMTAGQAFELSNILPTEHWAKTQDGKNDVNNFYIPSFSSPKWETVYYPFVRAFCERYKGYKDKGYIVFLKPSTAYTQEFCYQAPPQTDFGSLERAKFGRDFGDIRDLGWYKFRTENLKRVFSNIVSIAKSYGYKTQLDNGSTVDGHSLLAGSYGAEYFGNGAESYKENPDFSYNRDFVCSTVLSRANRKNATACIEITWTGISDLNQRKTAFLEWVRQAADWGFDYVYFSFLDPYELAAFNKLKEMTSDLKRTGHLTKNVQPVNLAGSVNYTVSEFIQFGGHQGGSILSRFDSAKQAGKPTNITISYNL